MIKAIFFDIDGTLTDFNTHEIPSDVFPVLKKLQDQGIRLIIATGRSKDGLYILKDYPFDGYITLNGQYCFDRNGRMLYENTISPDSIRILLDELEKNPVPCCFQLKNERVFNFRNEKVDEVHAITNNDDVPPGEIAGIDEKPIYQCMVFVDEQKEQEILKKLPDCIGARWHPTFFDLSPKGGTKVKGIDCFLSYFGIPLEETMAFGDGGNDLAMLKHVKIGVAMGNAGEELKQAADYVTSEASENGIEQALRYYGVLK